MPDMCHARSSSGCGYAAPRLTPPMRLLTGALGSPIRNLAGGAAFVAGVVALAVLGYTLSGWGIGDAFCMAVLTVFTVGYDEVGRSTRPSGGGHHRPDRALAAPE